MKKLLLSLFLIGLCQFAWGIHDHIEVRQVPGNPSQLGIIATGTNLTPLATYFPPGQSPSLDLYAFPGGAYATELTFSAFEATSATLGSVFVRVDILAVSGPAGGTFSFWEVGATSPTWTRPSGWTNTVNDKPSLLISEDNTGYGHLHGRAFTTNQPGTYDVTFQVVDTLGHYTASAPFVVHFTAISPPQLSISKVGLSIELAFTSRPDLIYDIQSSTTLNANDWTTIDTLDGDGGTLQFTDPIAGRPRVFYRLVEY